MVIGENEELETFDLENDFEINCPFELHVSHFDILFLQYIQNVVLRLLHTEL